MSCFSTSELRACIELEVGTEAGAAEEEGASVVTDGAVAGAAGADGAGTGGETGREVASRAGPPRGRPRAPPRPEADWDEAGDD